MLSPNISPLYLCVFNKAQKILDRYDITESALRTSHFFAQIAHESGGFRILFENLNYSAERLPQVWPTRFKPKGVLEPKEFAGRPEKIANLVYFGRMGNVHDGDGFKYRGRGLLQLTGREAYATATRIVRAANHLCPDFEKEPDAVIDEDWCLEVASAIWQFKKCNQLADKDRVDLVTSAINGGVIGIKERVELLEKAKKIWH